eukprot:6214670-Pleurochrysis_carterae.AAC.4
MHSRSELRHLIVVDAGRFAIAHFGYQELTQEEPARNRWQWIRQPNFLQYIITNLCPNERIAHELVC